MKRLLALAILLLAFGCQKSSNNEAAFTRFYEDGRAKPVVALVPIIDSSAYEASWSISEELTSLLKNRLSEKKSLFLPEKDENFSLSYAKNPFDQDIAWLREAQGSHDFLVFVELLEHYHMPETAPTQFLSPQMQSLSTNLISNLRIRVIDLRGKEPKIILQETIKDSYYITKNVLPTDYTKIVWGNEGFSTTPIFHAHAQLTAKIADRIEDYIQLAKSR